jgi:hypothetical protein
MTSMVKIPGRFLAFSTFICKLTIDRIYLAVKLPACLKYLVLEENYDLRLNPVLIAGNPINPCIVLFSSIAGKL